MNTTINPGSKLAIDKLASASPKLKDKVDGKQSTQQVFNQTQNVKSSFQSKQHDTSESLAIQDESEQHESSMVNLAMKEIASNVDSEEFFKDGKPPVSVSTPGCASETPKFEVQSPPHSPGKVVTADSQKTEYGGSNVLLNVNSTNKASLPNMIQEDINQENSGTSEEGGQQFDRDITAAAVVVANEET